MAGFFKRLENVAMDEDYAANSAFGGKDTESISGTIGRAANKGQLWAKWFAQPVLDAVVSAITGQKNHCQVSAAAEAERAKKLGES